AHSPFAAVEVRFARALLVRLAGEDELWKDDRSQARSEAGEEPDLGIVGRSPALKRLRRELRAFAPFDVPVFLAGESGTGKELAAEALHRLSPRSRRAFVAINCAALPEPLFESELFGSVKGAFTGA